MSSEPIVQLPNNYKVGLLCNLCNKLLSVPPIVYYNTGFVCGRCTSKTNEQDLIRISIFETLAQMFTYPCSYEANGCTNKCNFHTVSKHENACIYRSYACPFAPLGACAWQGILNEIQDHLLEHEDHNVDDFSKLEIKTNTDCTSIKFAHLSDETFILQIIVNKDEAKCWIKICYIGDPLMIKKMKYNIDLKGANKRRIKLLDIAVENDSTWEIDRNTMEELDSHFLLQTFGTTDILCDIEVIERNVILGENVKHLTDSKILFELECPICKEYMINRIIICVMGHSVCEECRHKLSICPICKSSFTDTRNYKLESLASYAIYPCKNEQCDYFGDVEDILAHQQHCTLLE